MVPSLTETLILANINVVGRTRYCIHPADAVKEIPIVGGTKQARWDRIRELNPDSIIVDKEENPKEFMEKSPLAPFVVHFADIGNAAVEFAKLADHLGSEYLQKIADRYGCLSKKVNSDQITEKTIPGFLRWLKEPTAAPEKLIYLIWQDPWMTINRETFIGSVFDFLGLQQDMYEFAEKYPVIDLSAFDPKTTLLLCSTEPFPFARKRQQVLSLPFSSALVDGEVLSWFGIRNLEYMEKYGRLESTNFHTEIDW